MKNIISFIAILLLPTSFIFADEKMDRVLEIDKIYANDKHYFENTNNRNLVTISADYLIPDSGQTQRLTRYYFEIINSMPKLKMIKESFNIGKRNFYREYLYDKNGELLFFYTQFDQRSSSLTTEHNCYYQNRQIIHSKLSKGINPDSYCTGYLQESIKQNVLFQKYMNFQKRIE
ncbi:MAG: hypothetical protein IK065_06830 [Neisseriaceae bacterium]|nr:hypothetical protein [Neisseriaceae bacterium]